MTDTTTGAYVDVPTAAGRVRGAWRPIPGSEVRSAAFLGIPFAQPPVGDLRFAAPVPVEPWEGVRDALEFGATAQRGDPGVTLIPEPSVPGDSTLNVNVFTPAPGMDAALPVLVWIHGGGYFAGSPASPWYDGRSFNRDGVVTVTISYRLGFIGFGHVDGAPDNRGVRDWIAALEWVQENIRAFGGDPSRVTIAGQSAGGGAVLTLLGIEQAQHLFHGAWALSPAITDISGERARTVTAKVANHLGIAPTRAALEGVDEDRLIEAQKAATDVGRDVTALLDGGLGLGPAIDGDLIVRPVLDSLRAGIGSDKPLVVGAADDEFSMILAGQENKLRWIPLSLLFGRIGLKGDARKAYLAANKDVVAKGHAALLGRYVSDKVFKMGVARAADARGDAPTWVYRYAFSGSPSGLAIHCIDVPFWFGCLDSPVGIPALAGDKPPQALADATHGAAVVLIREGRAEWPAWSDDPGITRVFGGPASRPDVVRDGYAGVRPLL